MRTTEQRAIERIGVAVFVVLVVLLTIPLAVLLTFWQAYVLKVIYTWYLAEWIGKPMTYAVALGISFIYSAAKGVGSITYKDHDVDWTALSISSAIGPAILLLFAWICRFFV